MARSPRRWTCPGSTAASMGCVWSPTEISARRSSSAGRCYRMGFGRLADDLREALVDLHEPRVDGVCGADRATDVVAPHVRREAVVRVVGHADDVGLIGPGDRDEHRAEDLLARETPVVAYAREHRR